MKDKILLYGFDNGNSYNFPYELKTYGFTIADNNLIFSISYMNKDGTFGNQLVYIKPDTLELGHSLMCVVNDVGKMYVLYNYKMLCQLFEFNKQYNPFKRENLRFMFQLDILSKNRILIKQQLFESAENTTQDIVYIKKNCKEVETEVDCLYFPRMKNISYSEHDGILNIQCQCNLNETPDIYFNHGGQIQKAYDGMNDVSFIKVPYEDVYLGEIGCRNQSKNRKIEIN